VQLASASRGLTSGQLRVRCSGVEFLDPLWVSPQPRCDADARRPRGERATFHTRSVALLTGAPKSPPFSPSADLTAASDCKLLPGERRCFRLQFTLPPGLPPTFRGGTFGRCALS